MHLLALPAWLTSDGLREMFGQWTLVGFAAIIFIECAFFVGMFFPGDSLLFLTGILVASNTITQPLWLVLTVLYAAAVFGNIVGYHFGVFIGPKLFSNPDARFLKPYYVKQTRAFFDKYGNKAIFLARFTPVVRSLITAVAGIAGMDKRRFYSYSAIGAIFWVVMIVLLGVWLGQFAWVQRGFEVILIAFVVVSTIPIYLEVRRANRES